MTSIPSIYDQLAERRAQPQVPAPAAPPAERTVYDDLLDRQQQQADLLRVASFNAAVKSDANKAAEAQRISQQLGLPADVAERNLEQVRAISAQRDYENRNLAAFSPILDRQLRDPEFARIAHDDLDRLSTWEGMVRGFGIGKLETEQGMLGERLRSGQATPAEIDRLAAVRRQLQELPRPGGFLAGSAKIVGQQAVTLPKALEVGMASGLGAAGVAMVAGQAGPQALVPEEVLTVPGAFLSGFGLGTAGAMAVQAYQMEAGSAYLDMVDRGYDKGAASSAAVGVGVANAALELVGMKLLAKGAGITGQALREALGTEVRQGVAQALVRPTLGRAALQFAKGYGTGLGGEIATETLQEGVNIVAEELARQFSENPGALESTVTRGEVIRRLVETATETAQGMALLAVPGPSMHLWSDSRRAAAAERQVRQFQALANGAVESKLRQRSPGAFEQFVKATVDGTGAENLFIDAQAFGQVLRQADLEAGEKGVASAADGLRATLPEVMQQVDEAMRTGGDVVIPTEKFQAHIAGTSLADQLLPHLRGDADAMSLAEAQVFRQGEKERGAEAQQILQQQETENRAFVEQARQVEESLRQQLGQTGKMAASEAVAAAKFYRDIVVTQANRAGMLPAEFVAKYPLRVLASDQPAAAGDLQQGDAGGADRLVALHALSNEKLLDVGKLGGLPAPSIAVSKVDDPFEWGSGVTLIGRSDLVNPEKGTPVFDSDIYSQRFPALEYQSVPRKAADRVMKELQESTKEAGKHWVYPLLDHLVQTPDRVRAIEELSNSWPGKVAFLRERGALAELPMADAPVRWEISRNPTLRQWVAEHRSQLQKERPGSEVYAEYARQIDAALAVVGREQTANLLEEEADDFMAVQRRQFFDEDGDLKYSRSDALLRDIDNVGLRQVDTDKISELAQPLQSELVAWATQKVGSLFAEPKIRLGKRLVPLTLDNAVAAMTASARIKGREKTMTFGAGQARAAMAKRYRTIAEIQADRGRVVGPKAHQAAKDEAAGRMEAYRSAALPFYRGQLDEGDRIDTWEALDASMRALADAGKGGKDPTVEKTRAALVRNGFRDPDSSVVVMANELVWSIRQVPVDYFEAKPQRAVMLKEFAGAVVREGSPAEVYQLLEANGIAVREYSDAETRRAAIAELSRELDRKEGGGLLFQPNRRKKGDKRKPLTPEELQKRVNRSQAAMAAAQTRRDKAHKEAQAGKLDLLAYIALNGGMRRGKTWPGSTLPEHLRVRGWEFLPVWSERAPMTWSQMAEMARGDGWFPGQDDDGNSSWSEETFINAVSDALDGARILHPNAYSEQSGGGFENEIDRMRRELEEVEDQRRESFSDPNYFRQIAEADRERGDVNSALYNEMLADAVQAGRELPEDYYLDEMPEDERRMMQWAALLDKLLPDRQGSAMVIRAGIEGLDYGQTSTRLLEAVKQARGIAGDPGAAAPAGPAEGGGADSGAAGGGSVAEVPAADGPVDVAGPDLTEQPPDQPVEPAGEWLPEPPDPIPDYTEEDAGAFEPDAPADPETPSSDLVQPIVSGLGGIDPETPGRGSYRLADFTIFLHRTADASTFLHELSHHYLHVLGDLASRPNAAPAIAADMQQLLQWFGVADLATWNSLTLQQQRNHHEAFAYSFELYLFEGKAPSQALEGLFARFARWLRRVYTTIRGELNTAYRNETGEDLPVLTPEVRGVMDRMVASDEEIGHQAAVRGMAPQFATQAESGMGDAEWLTYQELHQDQRDAASAQLTRDSLKQMQWLSGARAGLLRRMQQKHDALRAKVRDEVSTAVEQRPVYRAISWLRDGPAAAEGSEGATQDDGGSHRLASDAVRKLLPEGAKLGGVWRTITEKKGLAPDLVARLHRFRTGEDLVNAIAAAPALEAAIDAETDARMLAEHSDLADPQKRDLAVQAALHNEARTRFLGAELRHLTKATQPVRLMVQAAKSMATRILAGKAVGQIQPREHVVAEERARRASIQAMRRGESAAAGEQKRVELLQHHLAKGAVDARQEVDEALEQFEKLWDSDEKIGKARSIEHVAAARAILAHYGLGRGGKTPAQHMAQAHAYDSEVAQELQQLVDRLGAAAGKRTWRQVTLEEFRTMREAVEQLWFQGRRANEMVVEGRRVRIAAAAGELAARLEEIGLPARAPGDRGTETPGEQFQREGVLAGFASATRVEHWAAALGPVFTRYVFRPIADGLTAYRKDRNVYVQRYEQMLRAHREAGHLDLEDILAPELNGHVFRGKPELLGALLHTGNRSNLRKLVVGWKWHDWDEGPELFDTSRWDKFQARMIQKGILTKADFDFVQAVWDMNEGLKPLLQETHRGLYGHYFDEVKATEIPTQWGVYRGGYVPASADSTEQNTSLQKQLEELQGDYRNVVPATQRGFTKSRTDITRRLTLDIRQQAGHLDKVLRFAHVQPAVKDVLAVLKHRDLAGTLHRWNPTVMEKLLLPWLNRAASGLTTEPAKNKVVGRWLTQLRQNAGLAIMAFNVVNAAQNLAGILTARTLVAGRDLRASLFEVVGSPRKTAERIAGLSPMMASRMEGRIHELTSSIDELARGRGVLGKAQQLAGKYGYLLQKFTQGFVDQVVWIGAYNQAMREQSAAVGDKEAEAAAVARADAVVRRTQGSQEAEDVSSYETGTPLWKAFVQFGSWFNNNANLNVSEWVRLKRELGWRGVVGTRAGALALWGFLLPTLAASWIQQALGAGWDDDDDNGLANEYVGWFFASQGRALLASVPIAGQGGLIAWNFLDDKGWNDRMPQPAVVSVAERGLKALMGLDDGATGTRVRDVLTLTSMLVGVPLTVVGRPLGYAMSVDEGKVRPTGPVDFGLGLVTGQASAASKR